MKVCILAAGEGTRMGASLNLVHKALLPLGNKAILTRIINQFPKESEFVIALGFKHKQIEDYLKIVHPDLSVEFVYVSPYSGAGSGPGLSLYSCRDKLQEAFIFTACDTLITSKIPRISENWVGVCEVDNIEKWCSFKAQKGEVTDIFYKQAVDTNLAFVGIGQVCDYQKFWSGFEENKLLEAGELQVNNGLKALVENGMKIVPMQWEDAGNEEHYKKLILKYEKNFTFNGKSTDLTYLLDGKVIKFFEDEDVSKRRYHRACDYRDIFADVLDLQGSFYSYQYQPGILLSEVINYRQCYAFLSWAQEVLWEETSLPKNEILNIARSFYYEKTLKRLTTFCQRYASNQKEKEIVINSVPCKTVASMLDELPEEFYGSAKMSRYHGDLHTDNIIYHDGCYHLIDWRDSFGDSYYHGDIYYDLAKFLHTLELSVAVMDAGSYSQECQGEGILINHACDYNALEAIKAFWDFADAFQYDKKNIQIINGLIYVNMAPFYEKEMAEYLYYLGRYSVQRALQERPQKTKGK